MSASRAIATLTLACRSSVPAIGTSYRREQRAVGVDVTGRVGGAVQRQEHAVERSRRAQPRERLGEDPVEERLVAGTARAHCGEQGGQSCPWPGAVHAAREAEDGAWAARRSGVEIRGEVVAGEQDIRLELGARRHRSVAVGFQHEPAYGDARRGVDGPGHRIGLPC
jgi:hypothetical protein